MSEQRAADVPVAEMSTTASSALPDPSKWETVSPMEQIYTKIQDLFVTSSTSILQMEYPCRLLDRETYDYQGSDGINAQQIKPLSVAEAEFQLSDGLYDTANLVGGPNGAKLSSRYEEILFSLIPSTDALHAQESPETELSNGNDEISAWLEEEVPNFDPPTTDLLACIPPDLGLRISKPPQQYVRTRPLDSHARTEPVEDPRIPRVDLYRKLLATYEGEKARWAQYKAGARPKDDAKQSELDAYDQLLQTYAPVVDAKLEELWTLLVIRGQYHRVRSYISKIAVLSTSGILQQAKDNFRACVSRSVDDSQDIYPVTFSPANWAANLSTNLQPDDPGSVLQSLNDAEKILAMLQARHRELLDNSQAVDKTKMAVHAARGSLDEADASLASGISDSVLGLVNLYFNDLVPRCEGEEDTTAAVRNVMTSPSGINYLLTQHGQSALTSDAWARLCEARQACMTRESQLVAAQIDYERAQTALAMATPADTETLLYTISDQIASQQTNIKHYQSILKQTSSPTGGSVFVPGAPGSPDKARDADSTVAATSSTPMTLQVPKVLDGASMWHTIEVQFRASGESTENMVKSNVSSMPSSGGCPLWSANSTATTTTTDSCQMPDRFSTNVQMGCNVLKVDIERPWLNAGILNQIQQFSRTVDAPVATYDPLVVSNALQSFRSYREAGDESDSGLLPSFPTSFIVAKDVHIIYTNAAGFSESTLNDVQSSSSAGGRFLCFQSSSTTGAPAMHLQKTSVSSTSSAISVKIPAPQIIGWISELVAKDSKDQDQP